MPRRKAAVDPVFAAMFPDIEVPDDVEDDPAPQTRQQDNGTSALEARLNALQADLERSRRENLALTQSYVPNTRPNLQTELDLSKLPDPEEDVTKYVQAYTAQYDQIMKNREALQRWENEQQQAVVQRTEELWNRFASHNEFGAYANTAQNPKIARDRVEIAATRVAERAQAAGRDLNKYMYSASESFFEDVAKEMETLGWTPKEDLGDLDDGTDEEFPHRPAPRGLADRATDMFGGQSSGNRPSRRNKEKENFDDMMAPIREFQIKSGFHL